MKLCQHYEFIRFNSERKLSFQFFLLIDFDCKLLIENLSKLKIDSLCCHALTKVTKNLLWSEVAVPGSNVFVDYVPFMYVFQSCQQLKTHVDTLMSRHWLVTARKPLLEIARVEVLVDHHR